jgi:hypothetical protein
MSVRSNTDQQIEQIQEILLNSNERRREILQSSSRQHQLHTSSARKPLHGTDLMQFT